METTKLVKVYSNTKKSTRLKRNKNKYQRVWNAELQKYVKVRKTRFPIRKRDKKEQKSVELQMKSIVARIDRKKSKKNVAPVQQQKTEIKTAVKVHAKTTTIARKPIVINMFGTKLVWDKTSLRYKQAA